MKKYLIYPSLALAGGALAFLLRLAQNRTGFEAATRPAHSRKSLGRPAAMASGGPGRALPAAGAAAAP